MYRLLLVACLLAVGAGEAAADDVYTYIVRGDLDAARQALSERVTASVRDGNTLYFQSRLETNAEKAAQLMEAALRADADARYEEEIYLYLAQYYFAGHQDKRLAEIINTYRTRFEHGRYRERMQRFGLAADERSGQREAALRQADRLISKVSDKQLRQWVTVDRARIMRETGKNIGAWQTVRRLSRQKSGEAVPAALYLLALQAAQRKRIDDAVFYYSLLREGYPSAVGSDALVDALDRLTTGSEDNTAEKLTGTFYTVKVGVFSHKGNAKKQAAMFKSYGKKVAIKRRTISGKKYYVVYVGRFTSWDEAKKFKARLEATHGDVYQVVAL